MYYFVIYGIRKAGPYYIKLLKKKGRIDLKPDGVYFADAMAFIAPPAQPPVASGGFSDMDLVHVTAAPPFMKTMVEIVPAVRKFREAIEEQGFKVVERRADLDAPQTKVILGLQHPPMDGTLKELYDLGIRVTTIAYELENRYGGGFAAQGVGLMSDGLRFIKDCLDAGIILDLAHAGHQTARNIVHDGLCGDIPIMVSHTGCHAVYPHSRNLPDDVLEGVVVLGGLVGIYTRTFGLHPERDDLEPFFKHLEHAVRVCGDGVVVVGGDGAYAYQSSEEAKKQFEFMKEKIDPRGNFQARYPDHPPVLNHSYRHHVLSETIGRWYPPVYLKDGICGQNFRRFIERALWE